MLAVHCFIMLVADLNILAAYSPPSKKIMTFKIVPSQYYYANWDKHRDAWLNVYNPKVIWEGIL